MARLGGPNCLEGIDFISGKGTKIGSWWQDVSQNVHCSGHET